MDLTLTREEIKLITHWYKASNDNKLESKILAEKLAIDSSIEKRTKLNTVNLSPEDINILSKQLYRINKFNIKNTFEQTKELKKKAVEVQDYDSAARLKNLESMLSIFMNLYDSPNLINIYK